MSRLSLIRLSLLSISTYNKVRLIKILNIGIFISIFALIASFVSIYYENKIDKIEKKIIIEDINKLVFSNSLSETTKYLNETKFLLNLNTNKLNTNLFLSFLSDDKKFKKIFNERDLYYVPYFKYKNQITNNNKLILKSLKDSILVSDQEKDLTKIKQFKKKQEDIDETIKDLQFKINLHHKKYESVLNTDKLGFHFERIPFYKGYNDFNKIQKEILSMQINFFYDFNYPYFTEKSIHFEKRKKSYLNQISINSKLESRIIFFAFLIQVSIFIISQFFELTLDQFIRRKKNAKRN